MIPEDNPARRILGLASLARIPFNGGDLRPIAARLLERIGRNDEDANSLMDLSTVLQLMGQRDSGLAVQALALGIQCHYCLKASSESTKIRLLSLQSPGDLTRNNALEFLVEDSDIELHLLYLTLDSPLPETLPEHDIAMVAVCQSEQNRPILEHLKSLVQAWPQPVLCSPDKIDRLSRDGASKLLRGLPGVVMPVTERIDRQTLEEIGRSEFTFNGVSPKIDFPIIVRPIDSDKGFGMMKLEKASFIGEYLKLRPEEAFYVAPYVNYQGQDGQFRKYRILLIENRPFACHMAVSSNWMVHYMSAGMFDSINKRAEELQFFDSFDQDFAVRHHDAFLAIAKSLDLEYVGIDCGETSEGKLLVFEVDSGMTVHSMDPPEVFPYKKAQMNKVFQAFRQMLLETIQKARERKYAA